jgi:hypothetical protein
MRPLKRLLIFAAEAVVFVFGFVLWFTLAIFLATFFDLRASVIGTLIFCFSFLLALAGFVLFRRKTQAWKTEYDAVGYALKKAQSKLHPTRAKCNRMLQRTIIWAPSAVAAMVVFLFPLATHLLHPSSQYLRHFRIPIPWTATVFSLPGGAYRPDWIEALVSSSGHGRYGVTPFWDSDPRFSIMTFWSDTIGTDETVTTIDDTADVLSKEFRIGAVPLTCSQYRPTYKRPFGDRLIGTIMIWEVVCKTPPDPHRPSFLALFHGREESIPVFYKVVEGVTPVE